MSDLKFSCPSCGQHVQCDEGHAGENIPCPSCAQLVRVPTNAKIVKDLPRIPGDNPFAHDDSKVSYTPAEQLRATAEDHVPTLEENIAGKARAVDPASSPAATEREQEIASARASHPQQIKATPAVKPRLSFVLSGGAAPVPEENEKALTPEQKKLANPEKSPPDIKTIHE